MDDEMLEDENLQEHEAQVISAFADYLTQHSEAAIQQIRDLFDDTRALCGMNPDVPELNDALAYSAMGVAMSKVNEEFNPEGATEYAEMALEKMTQMVERGGSNMEMAQYWADKARVLLAYCKCSQRDNVGALQALGENTGMMLSVALAGQCIFGLAAGSGDKEMLYTDFTMLADACNAYLQPAMPWNHEIYEQDIMRVALNLYTGYMAGHFDDILAGDSRIPRDPAAAVDILTRAQEMFHDAGERGMIQTQIDRIREENPGL